MSNCPECSYSLDKKLSEMGGNCPNCGALILPIASEDDFPLDVSQTDEVPLQEIESTGEESPANIENIFELRFSEGDELSPISYEVDPDTTITKGLDKIDFQSGDMEATELISTAKVRKAMQGHVVDQGYEEDFPDPISEDFEDVPQRVVVKDEGRISWGTVLLLSLFAAAAALFLLQEEEKEEVVVETTKIFTPSIQSHQSRTPTETKTVEKTQKAKPKKVKKVAKAAKKEKKSTDAPPSFLPSIGAKKVERREITLDDLVDQSLKSLRFCNDSVMSKRPNYEGIMKLSFSVLPSGQVSGFKIRAVKGELLSTYKSCAERRVKKWSFPKQSAKKYVQREVEIF